MTALRIEFLAGRFHANPWDRGTNDGEVEWPPSPWRLLRAIVAGWHRARECDPDKPDVFLNLLDRLAEPPVFLLPRAAAGHTRHYMPLGTVKNGQLDRTLVLDSFITLDKGREPVASAYVMWPHVELTAEQRQLLARCCEFITYLGRAESWCAVHIVDTVPSHEGLESVDLASRTMRDGPTVRRLAAGPSLRGEGLLKAVSETTGDMRKARRLMPIGAAWAEYRLPPDFLMVREQYDRLDRTRALFGPTMLRFALERGGHSPKPSIKDTVVFAELLRAAAIKRLSKREGEPATHRLAGKNDIGAGPREGHDHPYFLPFDEGGRGEIDGIDVWFPRGCTHPEYMAVTSIAMLYERAIYHDDFPLTLIGAIERPRSRSWRSATPVVLDRFPKARGTNGRRRIVDSPESQIANMIRRALGRDVCIGLWPPAQGIPRTHGGHLRIDAFRRSRLHKNMPPLLVAAATIDFDEPVEGPIALGRLAHFGLGRFEPVNTAHPIDSG